MPKRILLLLTTLALILLPLAALAEISPLPIDFSAGQALSEANFADDKIYSDPSITVEIESGRYEKTDWWSAKIKIADPSQIRTVSAGGFETSMTMNGPALARRVNAVLAVDGDFYCFSNKGYIKRQGNVYWNNITGAEDMLFIDDKGDFHIVRDVKQEDIDAVESQYEIVNCLSFGPALIIDGEPVTDFHDVTDRRADEPRQRMCIAQVGELEYLCIATAGAARGSKGFDLYQFAKFVATFDVQQAYNLDGGNSTMMIFNGKKINDTGNADTRKISDIVYFASAYQQEAE